jgi:hypothetical protein
LVRFVGRKGRGRALTPRTFNLILKDSLGNIHSWDNKYWGYSDGYNQYYQDVIRMKRIFHTLKPVGNHYIYNKVIRQKLIIPLGVWFIYTEWKDWSIRIINSDNGKKYTLKEQELIELGIENTNDLWKELDSFNSIDFKRKRTLADEHYYNP